MKKTNRAFSLIELSIVILIIGVLIAATGQGIELLADAKVSAAKQMTQSSRVGSIKGLSLWLETVSEQSFLTTEAVDGSTVSTWLDLDMQSSDKNSPTQTTNANKPIYTADAMNSLSALKFDGVDDFLIFPSWYVLPVGTTAYTVFFVAQPSSSGGLVLRSEPGFSEGFSSVSSTQIKHNRSLYTSGPTAIWKGADNSALINVGKPVICASKYDGNLLRGWVNGGDPNADAGTAATGSMGVGTVYIGKNGANGGFFKGYIGEIIMFSRVLSSKEIDTVESYLSKKWNIQIN